MGISPTLLYGVVLAIIDVFVLSLLKMRYLNIIKSDIILVIAFLIYGIQALIFYKSLSHSTLVQMNLSWDLISDILVTFAGIYLFKESFSKRQKLGIVVALFALFLLK
jgi:drug/metabolite transporter (DMT)-like permease